MKRSNALLIAAASLSLAAYVARAANVIQQPRIPRAAIGPKIGVRKPKPRKYKGSKAARKAGRK